MAPPTPQQVRTRAAFERLIGIGAPLLDLVLTAGDRVSRAVGRDDDYIPIRAPGDRLSIEGSRGPSGEAD